MIRLEEVSKRYADKIAVDRLTLEVGAGETCVLIGPSGCGKTSTLRMINRLIEPSSGHILIDGRDTATLNPERLRQSIGYAIQNVGLFPHMTVGDNIAVVPNLLHWERGRIEGRVDELLNMVGLEPGDYRRKYPSALSGGEAQRVGVARALAADPPILLMDEPFGAVDPLTRERLQGQFVDIQHTVKKTIIFVTHDLDEAIRLGDRIAIMESGRLVQYDSPETILAAPANRFVRDFVGTDRALKRLSRLSVAGIVRPAPSVRLDTPARKVRETFDEQRSVWVVDEVGCLVGWLDRDLAFLDKPVREVMTEVRAESVSITRQATMREALSRMLGQGFHNLPVIDDKKRLIGEVTLGDIETATSEVKA